ncbi:MAG: hypothetical protein IJP96_02630 [Synergistaceae bacterium]|nr:hypothetical protein [Synergistaceae bacterium]
MNNKYFNRKKIKLIFDIIINFYDLPSQANSKILQESLDDLNACFYDVKRLLSDTQNKLDEINKNEYVELEYKGYLEWFGKHYASVNMAENQALKNPFFYSRMENNINEIKQEYDIIEVK